MDYQPPPFFSRGPAPLVRLGFFVSLAALLMVLDARFRYAESLRQVIALLVYPFQRTALAPVELFNAAAEFFTSQVALTRENGELKAKRLLAANDLLTLEALRAENAQLRRLLDARQRLPRKSTLAEILYQGRDPFSRKVVLDKGTQQGIRAGQAVIDDIGVIGQVTRTHLLLSEVTLITDKEQRTPVQVVRNGLRAIIYGGGGTGTLDLSYMAADADIQADDVLVTSGIDGTYPAGLPGAKVSRIERDAAYSFAKITCVPTAGTDRNRQVLVLSREAILPLPAVESEPGASSLPKQKARQKARMSSGAS
jgi:rod shape-determining protein MreC